MDVEPEIHFKDVRASEHRKQLIIDQAVKLERYSRHIIACRISVGRPNDNIDRGSGYRVRIDVTVPPRHELVVTKESWQGDAGDSLETVIRDAFQAMARQLDKTEDRRRGRVKQHPEQQTQGIIDKIYPDFGFIRSLDGREIYFHRNSVLDDFKHLEVGSAVAFNEELGDKGPQAATVRTLHTV
ncbi:MAG: cold shock domain-containing protein [Planctomycetota bacterium]